MIGLVRVSENLTVRIGDAAVRLSPREGLKLAEDLARKSFRRVLSEEAGIDPTETGEPTSRRAAKRERQ